MIKKFALAAIAVTLLALGTAFMLPREWRVERHVVINSTQHRVHAMLFDLKRWQDWSVWTRTLDPQLRNAYEGPQDGVGARWLWLGPKMGRGQVVIVASDPQRGIELDQAIESETVNAHASLTFTAEGSATKVTWVDEGTLPLIAGGFFRSAMEQQLGANLETSLTKLKTIIEAQTPPPPPLPVEAPDAGQADAN